MAKPHLYINVSQTLAVGGVIFLAAWYLSMLQRATDIQKLTIRENVKQHVGKVANVIVTPFRHHF